MYMSINVNACVHFSYNALFLVGLWITFWIMARLKHVELLWILCECVNLDHCVQHHHNSEMVNINICNIFQVKLYVINKWHYDTFILSKITTT